MEQIQRLSDDVLYIISEKLLFKKVYGQVDLRIINGCTLFMYHSARNMRAVLSHFSKMKRLYISNYGNNDSENNIFISFGRDDKRFKICLFYPFPLSFYVISKNFFSDLLEAGLLNISSIHINEILGNLPKIDFSATNKNIWKYLLSLEEKHLITLLSMNIENLEFCCIGGNIFNCDPKCFELILLERPSVPMERSKKIASKCNIEIKSTTNFVNNLINYIQFLLLSCPNLESIEFVFTAFLNDSGPNKSISDDDSFLNAISPEKFLLNLESVIISFIEHLKNLNTGGKNLKIEVEFMSIFDDDTFDEIDTDNKLFNLGKPFEIKIDDLLEDDEEYPAYYARNIEIVDSVGRQHECLVQIISEGFYGL
ncbi:unnamed protein product [Meloidogyne enterolobii]|uniref:Uncharacterized protein n=1 Tax=Meloidogyne enterolobii TaxID=390850 RepID=A0ACB0YZ66_MELEN